MQIPPIKMLRRPHIQFNSVLVIEGGDDLPPVIVGPREKIAATKFSKSLDERRPLIVGISVPLGRKLSVESDACPVEAFSFGHMVCVQSQYLKHVWKFLRYVADEQPS